MNASMFDTKQNWFASRVMELVAIVGERTMLACDGHRKKGRNILSTINTGLHNVPRM